jgi:hypothetical protein
MCTEGLEKGTFGLGGSLVDKELSVEKGIKSADDRLLFELRGGTECPRCRDIVVKPRGDMWLRVANWTCTECGWTGSMPWK